MDNKKILIVLIVIVAVVAVAAVFVMNNANSVKVGELDFKIPEGFSENVTCARNGENDTDGKIPYTAFSKKFDRENEFIEIFVFEFNSPDDANKSFNRYPADNGTAKTINNHEGVFYYGVDDAHEFIYLKDNYFIVVDTNNESLIEEVVK